MEGGPETAGTGKETYAEDSFLRNISAVIVVFSVCLLAFIWIGLYYKIQDERRQEINIAIKETGNFARALEEHSLRTIRSADQTVLFLKYQYEEAGRLIEIPKYITEGRLTDQPYVLLSVMDETGELTASSQVPFVPANLKDREHFQVHINQDTGKLFISKPVLGRASGKWSIQMTRRVNKADGSFGGVVVVSVDPFYFTNFYRQVDLGPNSSVALIGKDGIVRARQAGPNAEVGQDVRGSVLMQHVAEKETGYYIADSVIDGVKRIYSYRSLQDYPFIVTVGVDEAVVLAPLNQRVRIYHGVAGIVTLTVCMFMVLLLRAARHQKKVKDMLQTARDELEMKVEFRTQELMALNQELTALNTENILRNSQLQEANLDLKGEILERRKAEEALEKKNTELEIAYSDLKNAQLQIMQQEKMASIGQLAAGVAHEINNPMAFIISNLESLKGYMVKLAQFIRLQEEGIQKVSRSEIAAEDVGRELESAKKSLKIGFILGDMDDLTRETLDGAKRVKDIVQDLRGFARMDAGMQLADINEGIESTINIIWNEIKYKAKVVKDFGELPLVQCNLGQLNQVFMNILINAVQAIEEQGEIQIKTWAEDKQVAISIRDNGQGIPAEHVNRIFEPFFTTKEVGKGTGLGLSVSYDIVKKHHGDIRVETEAGKGTVFTITIPWEGGREDGNYSVTDGVDK